MNAQAQQLVYLYDLPKQEMTSVKIAEAFKEKAGVTLQDPQKPQIKKDITKPFYTAMVMIQDPDQYKQACEKMRYFDIEGKPCRALAFDKQLLGSNKEKLLAHNVFVKVPKNKFYHAQLHEIFSQFGPIKSLKVSLTPDYESNGYGFICFENPDSATRALEATEQKKLPEGVEAYMFKPRDNKSSMRKLINNIYVKNLPSAMSDDAIKKLFEPYGAIKSMFLKESEFGKFGFVCYDDPAGANKEYGPACAAKAIEALNEKDIDGSKLVVRCALSKLERDAEKKRETIRYKTSKKRCNLFVKNFPATWKKEQIEKLFAQFGEIEKVRLDQGKSGNAFAFVCFKEPNDAAKAKQNLHNHNLEGKTLNICYYEIKEIRQIQNEEAKDKADWEKYQAAQTGGFQWNELTNLPNLSHILTTLMQVIHAHEQQNAQNNQMERQNFRGGNRQKAPHPRQMNNGGGYNNNQMPNNMGQNMQGMPQQPMGPGGNNPMMGMPPPSGMPRQNIPQPNMGMPQIPAGMPNVPQGNAGNNVQQYLMRTSKILPAVDERNPHLKGQVGECIYDFIVEMIGSDLAPKITGMLIDLPVNQIKQYLSSYDALQMKVFEARDHLTQRMEQ